MKKLILFSDGTGNSSAKAQKTNVWRLFEALDQTTPEQLAKYDDGVGTSSNKYLAALGGAFGYGLKRNVIDLYKFVCRNHEAGDKIYGFGFSRGAFTIRVLVGLIATQGLVKGASESDLHAKAVIAYRQYRSDRFKSYSPFIVLGRLLRDFVLMPWSALARARHRASRPTPNSVPIEFLGLWDTVGAYGMPIDELKWGLNLLVWPMVSVDRHLFPCVKRACHALALDEQRQTFTPTLFDEEWEADQVKRGQLPTGRLTQVWFAGVHSNVGGGYPEDRLSLVSLDWMASQAVASGLAFKKGALDEVIDDRSPYARIYDSRAGVAAYYRYRPRQIDLGHYPDAQPIKAIVHGSVIIRLGRGSDGYAPISLPADFDVLAPDGRLIPMKGLAYTNPGLAMRGARPVSSTASQNAITSRSDALDAVVAELQAPGNLADAEMVDQVRDTVWWRRVTYFGTLFATLALLAFPLASTLYASLVLAILGHLPLVGSGLATQVAEAVKASDAYSQGPVGDLVKVAAPLLPNYLGRWLDALARQPLEMAAAWVLVAIPFFAGRFLGARIHDRAWFAWHWRRRADYLAWIRASFLRSLAISVAILVVLLGLVWGARAWSVPPEVTAVLLLASFIAAAVLVWRLVLLGTVKLRKPARAGHGRSLPITPTLWVARQLRTTGWLVWIYELLACKVIPILVALAVLVAGVCVAYHALFVAEAVGGRFCHETRGTMRLPDKTDGDVWTAEGFATSAMCWASGVQVKAGKRYRAELIVNRPWFDHLVRTDPGGFGAESVKHVLASPLKRVWSANWFAPMLRVGESGADEFRMELGCEHRKACRAIDYEKITGIDLPTFEPLKEQDVDAIVGRFPHPEAPKTASITFTAHFDGELFLYVNDAALLHGFNEEKFYTNNAGTGTLKVTELRDSPGG